MGDRLKAGDHRLKDGDRLLMAQDIPLTDWDLPQMDWDIPLVDGGLCLKDGRALMMIMVVHRWIMGFRLLRRRMERCHRGTNRRLSQGMDIRLGQGMIRLLRRRMECHHMRRTGLLLKLGTGHRRRLDTVLHPWLDMELHHKMYTD
jgi:hypothetical protein